MVITRWEILRCRPVAMTGRAIRAVRGPALSVRSLRLFPHLTSQHRWILPIWWVQRRKQRRGEPSGATRGMIRLSYMDNQSISIAIGCVGVTVEKRWDGGGTEEKELRVKRSTNRLGQVWLFPVTPRCRRTKYWWSVCGVQAVRMTKGY